METEVRQLLPSATESTGQLAPRGGRGAASLEDRRGRRPYSGRAQRERDMSTTPTAQRFVEELEAYRSPEQREKYQRYFKTGEGQYGEGDEFIGVRMGQIFALAKELIGMPPGEIEELLESPIHEVRAGALSIMDKQARRKKTPESRRKELFDLYLRRTDRINNWDLVDVGCPYVVGGYLFDKQGDVADTFEIAEILLDDDQDLIHKATGGWLREAGKKDPGRLLSFLDRYAATLTRTALRYAIERLDKEKRTHYSS